MRAARRAANELERDVLELLTDEGRRKKIGSAARRFAESNLNAVDAIPETRGGKSKGETAFWFTFEGFFWFPRKLLGIEGHLYAFMDTPEVIHAINQDMVDYQILNAKSRTSGEPVIWD